MSDAKTMYPSMATPAPSPAPSTAPTAPGAAAKMFPSMAKAAPVNPGDTGGAKPAAPTAATPAAEKTSPEREPETTNLYETPESLAKTYAIDLKPSLDRLAELAPEITPEQRDQVLQEASTVFSDAGINSPQAALLHGLVVHHLVEPADEATVDGWANESRQRLRAKYGNEASARLEKARAFVAARPGLRDMLDRTGLGNHPEIIERLVENAHRLRIEPRKKR